MNDDQIRGTAALLLNHRGEYLLHLRDGSPGICDPGTWSVPGGNRKPGESPETTIRRELLEEVGLVIPGLARFTVARSTGPAWPRSPRAGGGAGGGAEHLRVGGGQGAVGQAGRLDGAGGGPRHR